MFARVAAIILMHLLGFYVSFVFPFNGSGNLRGQEQYAYIVIMILGLTLPSYSVYASFYYAGQDGNTRREQFIFLICALTGILYLVLASCLILIFSIVCNILMNSHPWPNR